MLSALALAAFQAHAGNLVLNGNFGTGTFADWNVTPGTSGSPDISVRSGFSYSPSGNFGASFAQFGSPTPPYDTISQNITVNPGHVYDVSFYLQNNGSPDDAFTANFGGKLLLSLNNVNAFTFVQESYTDVPAGNGVLTFSGYQNPAQFALTDIVVTDAGSAAVPDSGPGLALMAATLIGVCGFSHKLRRRIVA